MPPPREIRIGYVPEHYLLPLHLCQKHGYFPSSLTVTLVPFPSGTGHMITSLRADEIDLAIGLTEGWVAGLLQPSMAAKSAQEKGYAIVGSWVTTPLRWAIVTGRQRTDIATVDDLRHHRRVAVSRLGSGSHVMAFVLAQQQGWLQTSADTAPAEDLAVLPLGPFKDLRDGVTGSAADFFMWEHFTTKPYFHDDTAPLKKIGEIYTPWPSWHIAASIRTFPHPGSDADLAAVLTALDRGIASFDHATDQALAMLQTGEAGCHYSEEDGREWLKDVQFVRGTRGVDAAVMHSVADVLQKAGVIAAAVGIRDGDGVVGIAR